MLVFRSNFVQIAEFAPFHSWAVHENDRALTQVLGDL